VIGILILFLLIVYERKLFGIWAEGSNFVHTNFETIFMIVAVIIVTAALYFGIALLYYFGPSNRKTFKFFSAGATLATIMIIVISKGYTLYINHFANFDELYGSVGTLMILMLWIYLMSFALLIGFELNASVRGAIDKKRLDQLSDIDDRYDGSDM
jgi:membrane protein